MAKVIVSIDFGTSTTSYCYLPLDSDDIIPGNLSETGERIPTEIIYSEANGEILAFGLKCIEYLQNNQLGYSEYYFKDIKMHLYNGEELIEDQGGKKKHKIVKVISKVLEYIKKHALKSFEEAGDNYSPDDIR